MNIELANNQFCGNALAAAMPPLAHRTAIALSAAFGHLWANTWAAQAIATSGQTMGAEAIAELLERAQALSEEHNAKDRPSGIELADAITVGAASGPMYQHRTGSGRLRWEVRAVTGDDGLPSLSDWLVDLEIWRPDVAIGGKKWPAMQAIMVRYSTQEGWEVWSRMGAPFYSRHVRALEEALFALKAVLPEFPAEALQTLMNNAHSHAEKSATALLREFTAKHGKVAAAAMKAVLGELGGNAYYLL